MEFEYRIVTESPIFPMGTSAERQAILNALGEHGWRLVYYLHGEMVFMREKPGGQTGPSEIKEVRDGS